MGRGMVFVSDDQPGGIDGKFFSNMYPDPQ